MASAPDRVVMIGTDPSTRGGISAALAAWDDAGLFARWPVTYIPTHRDGSWLQKLLRAVDALAAFTWLAIRVRCAILHVHGASRASFWRKAPFMVTAHALDWPVVFHLHGGGFATFYERECGPFARALVRATLGRADRIVVVSERWEAWVRATFAHPEVHCVPNAVPLCRHASPGRDPARLAFVGRLTRDKGAFDLVEAVALLRASHPQLRLELAGDGELDAVARRVRELGIHDRVLIRGWCDAPGRERLLERAGLFVLPSHVEGSPMSLLEAMACGCAVVATRVGGIPDTVRDGANGLLVAPGDVAGLAAALARLLDDRALATRLGTAARATIARRHAPAAAIDRVGRIYSGLGLAPVAGATAARRLA